MSEFAASDASSSLEEALEQLSRFEAQAWRVPAATVAKVRAVFGERIAALGGEVPGFVDLDAHPARRATPPPSSDQGVNRTPVDFDFDQGATPAGGLDPRPERTPTVDQDNPRYEDLSAYELSDPGPDVDGIRLGPSERTDGGSLAFQLDDVPAVDPPTLILHAGTAQEEVLSFPREREVTLGRGKTCHVRLDDARASRVHCRLFQRGEEWCVEDLASANGTTLNGGALASRSPRALAGGEELTIGSTTIRIELGVPVAA